METTPTLINENRPQPFLRWVGGKRWFLTHLKEIIKDLKYQNYHEPFLGGASVFLFLNPSQKAYLSDLNEELINTYISIRDEHKDVISELKKFKNSETEYYRIRNSRFKSAHKKAARFIYLNQTSFNGIYRVNSLGKYNVPYGFRHQYKFDFTRIKAVSTALRNTELTSVSFEKTEKNIKKNDLVFLDPPYTVSHNNNGFIKYNQKIFSLEDQYLLSKMIDNIKSRQAYYILTNAAHQKIEEIFEKNDKKIILKRASLIGGTNAIRGNFEEAVFTNI